jgi:formylglycine-generating enzyme required for sulfatase activity
MAKKSIKALEAQIAALKRELGAKQTGSGGQAVRIANVTAGKRGVAIGGNFQGNVYQGRPPKDDRQAIAIYRRMLVLTCRQLPLRGVHVGASDAASGEKPLDLDQVYVSLDTTTSLPEPITLGHGVPLFLDQGTIAEERRLSALNAVAVSRRVVLLGDPGSGKSTFVNHLSLCLALNGLEPSQHWCEERVPDWPKDEANLLPLPVILRDFARTIPSRPSSPDARTLWRFILEGLARQCLSAVAEPIEKALDTGQVIVLLDGLDEVATPAQRKYVRDAVQKFAERYQNSRFLVTCRTLSYQDQACQLRFTNPQGKADEFPAFTLAPFNEQKIDQFIAAWFGDLQRMGVVKADDAEPLTRGLQSAIRRPDLWQLASNPLLLTVMALVHTHKGRLPDARALLYEDTVEILLWRWEQLKLTSDTQTPGLRQLLVETGRSDVDLKRTLWRLAYEAHHSGGREERLADIGEFTLQQALAELHPDRNRQWAWQVIQTIKLRAGLLLERLPQVYTFPHRTFQEYLAGAHLASQAHFAQDAAKLVEAGAFWREVILLAVGKLVYLSGDIDKPLSLVGELCPELGATTLLGWQQAWLAGEVLGEMGLPRVCESVLGRDLFQRVQGRLAKLIEVGTLAPVERAKAGIALGKLGDPRDGVGIDGGLPDIGWITIPPGPFPMGNDEPEAEFGNEMPRFICPLIKRCYRIGRYPITVAQYQTFVDAGGYGDEGSEYWTKAGSKWKQTEGIKGPEDYQPVFQTPNHPRVGVSWSEAVAFCRWLTAEMRRRGELKEDQEITLPTEAQWERAARHTDGRSFPWGRDTDDLAQRCNMDKTGIGHTSAVGLFPSGLSQCEAADLAGNVWEWCVTKWPSNYRRYEMNVAERLDAPCSRVLRGGSWRDVGPTYLRCAYRNDRTPDCRSTNIGFRCVWVGDGSQ